jgi:hypothetical protein
VRITAENGARYSLADRDRDGNADGVILRRKALLLDVPTGQTSGFVVITPQAIAAVRGTKWAVDAQSGKTSVFVVDGRVGVRRPSSSVGVLLGAGRCRTRNDSPDRQALAGGACVRIDGALGRIKP